MREGETMTTTTGNTQPATCTMSWQEWTALLQAYISWMNSQLRKKAGYRRVLDLRTDLQDGVALAQLVEILGGKRVPDLDEAPCTLVARRKNVERLIHHLTSSKVNIPDASAAGIIEGDLRRLLQLIHAIAAHFKPSSVQKKIDPNNVWDSNQEQADNVKIQPEKGQNGVFRAQQRLPVTNKVNNQSGIEVKARESKLSGVIEIVQETPPKSRLVPQRATPPIRPLGASPVPERVGDKTAAPANGSNVKKINGTQERDMNCCRIFDSGKHSKENGSSINKKSNVNQEQSNWEEDRKNIAEDVVKARKQLLYLRDILMRGYKGPHDDPRRHPSRIKVDEKSKTMGVKSFKLDANFHIGEILEENDRLRFENENLTKQVEAKETQIGQLKDEIQLLEEKLEGYQTGDAKIGSRNGQKEQSTGMADTERVENEEQNKESQDVLLPLPYRSQQLQDAQLLIVKDALSSLRRCFPATDSNQHTLDTIEQSMATLLERVSIAEAIANNSFQMDNEATSPRDWLYMESRDRRSVASPTSEHSLYGASSVGSHSRTTQIERHTKVIYFFNKSTTPFITSIPKKIGDITLRDFKILFDRPGQFRFHFKTLDPDYGMVKEEVLHDEDIIPGWDNKVIGWVEDDV